MNTKELTIATKELTKAEKKLEKAEKNMAERVEKAVNRAREKASASWTKKIEYQTLQVQDAKAKIRLLIGS